jgi:2-polyprenyl-6-methoxyphenol hydroxylase-like FAD-dependent oxidoreductase
MAEAAGTTDVDVLIVGAGPTGLVLAIELARRGIALRLVDKSDKFFGGSRADGIMPRTLEVLADIGIADTVLAEGNPGIEVRGYQGQTVVFEGRTTEPMPARPDVPYPNIWFLPQFRTEELLRERLAGLGHHVEQSCELRELAQDDDGVTVALAAAAGTRRVRARYVVGTDGGHSTVRNLLAIPFDGETDDAMRALFADVALAGLDRDHGRVWMTGESGVALMPLSGTDLFTLTARPPESGAPTLEYLQEQVTAASGNDAIRLRDVTWSTVWRANARLARRFTDGRVFLAGDAAHVCPPTGGQGMNTGISDACNLAWKLAAVLGGADTALLDSYPAERVPTAQAALALAAKLLDKHQRGDEDAHHRGSEVHQLGLNYRGGPLTEDLRAEPGRLAAGDRAPDAPCGDVRLFDLFRGTQWTVLAFGADTADLVAECTDLFGDLVHAYSVVPDGTPGEHTVVDTDGHARAAYQMAPGTVVLVRPDGYLGLVGTTTADLRHYLSRVTAGVPVA